MSFSERHPSGLKGLASPIAEWVKAMSEAGRGTWQISAKDWELWISFSRRSVRGGRTVDVGRGSGEGSSVRSVMSRYSRSFIIVIGRKKSDAWNGSPGSGL